jgi:hypothetical protein
MSGQSPFLHWDGTVWGTVDVPGSNGGIAQVVAFTATDAWALDSSQDIFYWGGGSWREGPIPEVDTPGVTYAGVVAIGGTDPSHVWAFVNASNGSFWYALTSSGATPFEATDIDAMSVIGGSSGDAWAVGPSGAIVHLESGQFAQVGSGWTASITAAWGIDPDVWFAGISSSAAGTVLDLNGGTLNQLPPGITSRPGAITGTGPTDLWVNTFHFDGTSWTDYPLSGDGTGSTLSGMVEWSSSNVWAVADSIYQWGGNGWANVVSGGTYSCIAGDSPNNMFAGGDNIVSRWTGGTWSPDTIAMNVAGVSDLDGDVWLAGSVELPSSGTLGAQVAHLSSAGAWKVSTPTASAPALTGITSRATSDVWAVGVAGTVLHYNGTHWESVVSGTDQDLQATWSDAANVWVAGEGGAILVHP